MSFNFTVYPLRWPMIGVIHFAALMALGMVLGGCAASPARGPATPTLQSGFLFDSVTVGGEELLYAVYVPRGLEVRDPSHPAPMVVFLHGRGECGRDGQKMIVQGIGSNILWNAARWPCVVLFPQKPEMERAWEDYDAHVMAALERVRGRYAIDPRRIALTGLSQGGHGTWALGAAHPEVWCALAPICGYPEPLDPAGIAARVKSIPIWCFHGEADDVVVPERSRVVIEALRRAGASPRFTQYPGVNHGSWDRAYAEPDLPAWLLTAR